MEDISSYLEKISAHWRVFRGEEKNHKVATTLQLWGCRLCSPGARLGFLLFPFFGLMCTDLGLSLFAFVASCSRLAPLQTLYLSRSGEVLAGARRGETIL